MWFVPRSGDVEAAVRREAEVWLPTVSSLGDLFASSET